MIWQLGSWRRQSSLAHEVTVLDKQRQTARSDGGLSPLDADDQWFDYLATERDRFVSRENIDEFPVQIDPNLDPRWSVHIPSAEDDDFVSDHWPYEHDDADPFGLDARPAAVWAQQVWKRLRSVSFRVVASLIAALVIGVGLRFGPFFNDNEDLAAVGTGTTSTTAPPSLTPTSRSLDALAATGTSTPAPGLPTEAGGAKPSDAVDATEEVGESPTETTVEPSGEATSISPLDRASGPGLAVGGDYASNLAVIRGQTVRNRNEDDSPFRNTPSAELVPENHYGPRSEYLATIDGNKEPAFPVPAGGQFRVACEFSHFAYDDPLVFPNQPGASHLHMFFGNTDANAFSTADSIRNSGGATCNGSELNRTAYWVPALFDSQGSVRVPERIVIYYKGEGLARGKAEVFPEGAAMIASVNLNTVDPAQGGARGKFSYNCANNYSGVDENLSNTMPACSGNRYLDQYGVNDPYMVLEVNVKFPQCWNGKEPGNPANFAHPRSAGWYGSVCDGEFNHTLVNLEYFVNYRIEPGESTDGWYLSSDVSPTERVVAQAAGSTIHGDWWGGWHKDTNQMFIDNCVNLRTATASGCGFGYLTDGGPNNAAPYDGPALKLRDQYLGPLKVAAEDLYRELCPSGPSIARPAAAAFCHPTAPTSQTSLFCPVHQNMYANDPRSPLST